MRYTHLQQEVDALKLQIKELVLKEQNAAKTGYTYNRPIRLRNSTAMHIEYSL